MTKYTCYVISLFLLFRDVFYQNVRLFRTQSTIDKVIEDIACALNVPRSCLHIVISIQYHNELLINSFKKNYQVASSKGLVAGDLKIYLKEGNVIDCSIHRHDGILIPQPELILKVYCRKLNICSILLKCFLMVLICRNYDITILIG